MTEIIKKKSCGDNNMDKRLNMLNIMEKEAIDDCLENILFNLKTKGEIRIDNSN